MRQLYHADPAYYEDRAGGLLASASRRHSRRGRGLRHDAPMTEAGARAVVAAEHGCDGWADLLERVAALAGSDEPFLVAYRAVEAHDVDALRAALDAAPDVVREDGHERQRPARDGDVHVRRADRRAAAGARRGRRPRQRARLDGAAPGGVGGAGAADAAAARRGRAGRGRRARLRRDAARRGAVLGPGRDGGAAGRALARAGQPARGGGARRPGAARRGDRLRRPPARSAASTGRMAASRPGRRRTTRPRSSTRRSRGRRATTASTRCARWSSTARGSTPTSTAAPRWRGRRRRGEWRRSRRWSRSARTSTRAGRSAGQQHGSAVTALHLAAQSGKTEAVRALLAAGADRSPRDALYDGTPADWAGHAGADEAAALLRG